MVAVENIARFCWNHMGCGWVVFLLGCFSLITPGMAHEDPRGETHPKVTAKKESFEVACYFYPSSGNNGLDWIVREISLTGGLLKETRSFSPPFRPSGGRFPQLAEEQSGLEIQDGNDWIVLPEWSRKHGGKPYLIRVAGEKVTYQDLAWVSPNVDIVQAAVVDRGSLIVLATRSGAAGVALWLHRFNLTTFREEASVQLPTPATIYSFPVCSNLIEQEGKYYVSVVVETKSGYELVLCAWDGSGGSARLRSLTTRIDWNTEVSMANIGDAALVAYHYPGEYSRFFNPDARIRTIPVSLSGKTSGRPSAFGFWFQVSALAALIVFLAWSWARTSKGRV